MSSKPSSRQRRLKSSISNEAARPRSSRTWRCSMIHGHAVSLNFLRPLHNGCDLRFRQHHRQQAVLHAVVGKDVGERWRDDGAEAEIVERPRRMLARRAAAEIAVGDQDAGAAVTWLVEREVRVERAVRRAPPVVEQKLPEAGALDALEELLGNDLVGIHVGAVERRHQTCVRAKRLHWKRHLRMSVKCPATAAAAAIMGLTR